MKKFLILGIAALVMSTSLFAQTALTSAAYPANTIDTVTNTATKYLVTGKLVDKYKAVSVVATVTEISGTTGGTVSLEASWDGTNWYSVYASADSTYTFTPADQTAAQSYRWKLTDFGDAYLRVKYTGTGTMSAKIQAVVAVKF